MVRDPLALGTLIALITALAFWLDYRYRAMSKVSASLLVIIFGALLSNTGFVPHDSPVYAAIEGPVTSLAIVFLLLGVALADLKVAGPKMLTLFAAASLGTALGAFVGALIFAGALGDVTWKLAGAFTGTYTGGSLNFAALGRGLGLPSSTFAAAAAADNVTTGIWMAITLAAPIWLIGRWKVAEPNPGETADIHPDDHPWWGRQPVSLLDLVQLAAISLVVMLGARVLANRIGLFPEILWLTTIALALAQLPAVRALQGAQQLGNLGLHFFFAVIGIRSLLGEMLRVGPEVFYYTLLVVGVHGAVLLVAARVLRGPVSMMAVASQAAIGGPSTAMAIAISRNWPALALPGVAVGLLGYALGNYSGYAVAYLVRMILGG